MSEAAIDPNDPVVMLSEAIAFVSSEDRSGWSAPARAQRVGELASLVDRLQAELVRAVDELDRDQGWQADGAVSPQGWLTAHTPVSSADAGDLVRAARFRRRFDATAAALAAGELTASRLRGAGPAGDNRARSALRAC